uniref:BTB domain-containing protein n=1 Tax=Ditylenchus dipsaci TaxID=166011 RepID=A0A915EM65_9BILA
MLAYWLRDGLTHLIFIIRSFTHRYSSNLPSEVIDDIAGFIAYKHCTALALISSKFSKFVIRRVQRHIKLDVSVHPSGRQINRRPSFTTVMNTTKDDLSKMFDAKIVEIDAKIDAKIAEMSQNFEERMRKVLEEYLVEREKTHKEHKRNIKLDVVVDGDADTSLIPCTNDEDLDFFAAWSKIQSDCSLLVDDGLVRVNKKLLSAHSRYFEELLSDNVAEVGIEDVSHADMFHLLIVIYQISGKCEITEDKVESLLKLASKFRVPSVTKRCEVHLKNSVGVAISKKLQLSQTYGLHVAVDGDADTSLIPCTNDEEADCFASWSNIPSDCCLLVQGRLIHANKKLLSAHSQHFEELLSDDVAEVGIEDVSHADMFHLLIVIYQISGKCEITEDKVESLLKLASKFRVPNVTKRCEVYLKDSVGVAVARNLQLSQTYGLKSVQEDAVKQMTKLEQSEALVNKVGDKERI